MFLQIQEIILNGGRPEVDDLLIVPHYRELMIICWEQEPENRPSFKQVGELLAKLWLYRIYLPRAHVVLQSPCWSTGQKDSSALPEIFWVKVTPRFRGISKSLQFFFRSRITWRMCIVIPWKWRSKLIRQHVVQILQPHHTCDPR